MGVIFQYEGYFEFTGAYIWNLMVLILNKLLNKFLLTAFNYHFYTIVHAFLILKI